MRTLTPTLLAAQRSSARTPYIEAEVRDFEQGIARLSWTRLYTGTEPHNHHGIAFDGQGNMHRIRADAANALFYQRITSPAAGSPFATWTQIATDCAGPCAIAAFGARVYIFYRTTANVLWRRFSHDHGATWTTSQLSTFTEVASMAACWWGTTINVVCFAIRATSPARIARMVVNTDTQAVSQAEWSDGTHPLLATFGIGATFNPTFNNISIVLAGRQSATPYNHLNLFRTSLSPDFFFAALRSFLMAPDGEGTTYEYPDCHQPSTIQPFETTRVTAVEKFTGTTAYTRPLTCHLARGTDWPSATFTEPKPFLADIAPTFGLRLQSTADFYWLSMPSGVWRAPRTPPAALLLTSDAPNGRILALSQICHPERSEGSLTITLDNSRGRFASPGTGELASLRFRSEVVLRLGYRTTAGAETSHAGTYWIDSWEYSSTPNASLFTLHCLDGSGLMDRWSARFQMRWNTTAVDPHSVWQILYTLLARVGINLTNTPPQPQSSPVNNFLPDFTLQPGTQGTRALNRLLSFVPDQLVFRSQEAFTKNPLATEASVYSYVIPAQAGISDHPILAGEYHQAVSSSRTRAIGRDAANARIVQDAFDWSLLSLAIDILEQHYDPNLATATRAQERADALLRRVTLSAAKGLIVTPTNVGLELQDVITVTDPRCGITDRRYRVADIRTDYDSRRERYDQHLALCAP
jgi:hypothetical protein